MPLQHQLDEYCCPIYVVSCTSAVLDHARQSWQESRQTCAHIATPSEREFCQDMAWQTYATVLRRSAQGDQELAADRESRHAKDELRDLSSQMNELQFQIQMNKYES